MKQMKSGAPLPLALFAGLGLAMLTPAAGQAMVLPGKIAERQHATQKAFVEGDGFRQVDPQSLWTDDWYSTERFPNAARDSVLPPDHSISAVVRAILVVEKQEGSLELARYRITIRRVAPGPDYPDAYTDLIEVSRFNLGPARHDALASENPGVPVAPKAAFGVGPDVTWRFAMQPVQGRRAAVTQGTRHEMTAAEAAAAHCLGTPCLSLEPVTGPGQDWKPLPPPEPHRVVFKASDGITATPAWVANALLRRVAPDGLEPELGDRVPVQATMVISKNVLGQDASITGLLHEGQLQDDAISDIWLQRRQAGPSAIQWRRQVEYWPGRQ